MYSEDAGRLLHALRAARDGVLCVPCAGLQIHEAKWDVMKLARELSAHGDARADYRVCPACDSWELVVRICTAPAGRRSDMQGAA